jgi:NitT/TauT family transport system substrate-binding protein
MLIRRTRATTRTQRLTRTWLASLAAATLLLSACAGGSRNESGTAASGGATGGAQTLPLVMRATGPTFTDLTTLVIVAQNYWEKVGLQVDFQFITASNAATATQALIARQMDVASGGTGSFYTAYAEGKTDLVGLGTVNPSITFGLAVNNDTAKQLAAKGVTPSSPVEQRVQALKGLQIAASPQGSTGLKYTRIMLSTYGVDPDKDVTIVPNADNAAQVAATKQGRTNAFANSFPNTNLPEADGWGLLWLNWAKDLPSILPLAAHEYYTTRTWLNKNQETAQRLMKAVALALADLQNPTADLKKKVQALEGFKDLNPKAFDQGWELSVEAYKGASPVTTQKMVDNQLGLVNYGREAKFTATVEQLYDLKAAKAATS